MEVLGSHINCMGLIHQIRTPLIVLWYYMHIRVFQTTNPVLESVATRAALPYPQIFWNHWSHGSITQRNLCYYGFIMAQRRENNLERWAKSTCNADWFLRGNSISPSPSTKYPVLDASATLFSICGLIVSEVPPGE